MPEAEENPCWERLLRKQLLVVAALVVGVTYLARMNPPGGAWQDNMSGHMAGESILLVTNGTRYRVFYYCNSAALTASVVLIFLLLLKKPRSAAQLAVLRIVMVLDLLSLIGAYATGSSRKISPTLYFLGLATVGSICYLAPIILVRRAAQEQHQGTNVEELNSRAALKPRELRKVLMLLTSFMAIITYIAGLSLSGGSWDRVESNDVLMGLDYSAKMRPKMLFYFNATAFFSALVVVPMSPSVHIKSLVYYGPILGMLVGLLGAYAAGTCHNKYTCVYVIFLIALVVVMISATWLRGQSSSNAATSTTDGGTDQQEEPVQLGSNAITRNDEYKKVRSLILLLATLAATATYQAGLHPPGSVWPDMEGHPAGYPILLSTQPSRYKVFLYCNSGASVLSMAAILVLMVSKDKIHTTLLVSMILDMVAIMGAYAAGSWRDARSSIFVVATACCVTLYLMIHHLLCVTLPGTVEMEGTKLLKRHKRLFLVVILLTTVTYQAGLNPPGGFRRHEDDVVHAAGGVLLMDNHPRRLWAFFYCNTVSFMATLALVLLFIISPNLYRRVVRCYALYGCIVLALLCLIVAYTGGIVRRMPAYIYDFGLLVIAVPVVGVHIIQSRAFLLNNEEEEEQDVEDGSSAVFGHAHMPRPRPRPRQIPRARLRLRSAQETMYRQVYTSHKHLILLGILAAGTTYQAGLNPPGGLWQDNGDHGGTGSPVMYDSNMKRYLAFFYSNSTSFAASVVIVALRLHQIMQRQQLKHRKLLALATNTALLLDLLGILAAYAASTIRDLGDAIALVVLVLFCLGIHAAPRIRTLYLAFSSFFF